MTESPPAHEEGLRARKKRRTRESLVESALRLFQERGYDATTVDDITETILVSRRTFFRYFGAKEEVLFYDYDTLVGQFRNELAKREAGESAFQALRRAGRANAEAWKKALEEDRETFVLRLRLISTVPALVARDLQLNLQWEDAISEALAPEFVNEPDGWRHCVLLAGAAMGAVRAVVRTWDAGGFEDDIVALVDEVFDVLEQGFRRSTPLLVAKA